MIRELVLLECCIYVIATILVVEIPHGERLTGRRAAAGAAALIIAAVTCVVSAAGAAGAAVLVLACGLGIGKIFTFLRCVGVDLATCGALELNILVERAIECVVASLIA